MKNVLASAIEAELGALFVNFQQGYALRISIKKMLHQQPLTPEFTYRATSNEFVNNNIPQQKSRAIEMRLYWVS